MRISFEGNVTEADQELKGNHLNLLAVFRFKTEVKING